MYSATSLVLGTPKLILKKKGTPKLNGRATSR